MLGLQGLLAVHGEVARDTMNVPHMGSDTPATTTEYLSSPQTGHFHKGFLFPPNIRATSNNTIVNNIAVETFAGTLPGQVPLRYSQDSFQGSAGQEADPLAVNLALGAVETVAGLEPAQLSEGI